MRTSALERPEAPLARAPCSSSTTRFTPREASAQAMLIPLTPPPTTTTSAVSAMALSFRRPRAAALSAARLHVPGIERVAGTVAQEEMVEEGVRLAAQARRAAGRQADDHGRHPTTAGASPQPRAVSAVRPEGGRPWARSARPSPTGIATAPWRRSPPPGRGDEAEGEGVG